MPTRPALGSRGKIAAGSEWVTRAAPHTGAHERPGHKGPDTTLCADSPRVGREGLEAGEQSSRRRSRRARTDGGLHRGRETLAARHFIRGQSGYARPHANCVLHADTPNAHDAPGESKKPSRIPTLGASSGRRPAQKTPETRRSVNDWSQAHTAKLTGSRERTSCFRRNPLRPTSDHRAGGACRRGA